MTFQTMPTSIACKITANSTYERNDRIRTARYGDGYGQYIPDGINNIIDIWNLEFAILEGTALSDMNTFLNTYGTTNVFLWTPPGESVAKKWRIKEKSIKKKLLSFSQWSILMTIEQQFDLG